MDEPLRIENLKTPESDLEETLNHYDLDDELEAEFDDIEDCLIRLQVRYQSLLNTRRYLING
jgi:hypothetical protein